MNDAATFARLARQARDPAASLHEQHAAFGEIVRRSQHIVFGLALASLRDVEDAKDAAQDALATAWHRLPQLRDPGAFLPWLRTIVATACARKRRKRTEAPNGCIVEPAIEAGDEKFDYQSVIASALEQLPAGERDVTILFYFLGYTLPRIAEILRLKTGTVGKRLHSARLRIRRGLPRSVRADFVLLRPTKQFAAQVNRNLLDEYAGEYRFDRRPDLVVRITRDGDTLISEGGGQRHPAVLVGPSSLLAATYDGEARFRRNQRGDVTHFVYYEFGRRLGVARKMPAR